MTDLTDLTDVIRDNPRARIVDIWEFPHDRMCMLVQMDMIPSRRPPVGGPLAPEATPEPQPAYYTGYVQTTLSYGTLCGEDSYPSRVEAPGGITYGPDDGGWVGFDCSHAWDVCVDEDDEILPGNLNAHYAARPNDSAFEVTRWSPDDVRGEIESLADQLQTLEREEDDG